ncbi:unnamed protein product [Rotaria sordida]|uniref:SAP domain-containing protein n=1 Tax=Rotaria sordida TaxID=392033 RepID=A0A818R273_9BILA|nr:unnamed protein product [Rotaria sordida]
MHRVIKITANNPFGTVVAGVTNTSGSQMNQLNNPRGIFVDVNYTLYVADVEQFHDINRLFSLINIICYSKMLVHLSSTSPYVCDISLGPIEQANRMASAPTKQSLSYLEIKESFPKFRTPLKLLAPDEIPIDTNIASTIENNPSRQQSLQPIWYTEQTIVDDNNEQQRNIIKSPCHHELTRSTLPTIESNSPDIEDEIIEKEIFSNQPSLMRKSSTFTIEQQPSINIPSTLNESEKENDFNTIMTSTQEVSTNPIRHPPEPSDESFRALEHLLGLGSPNPNITMITTTQESPKSNHESLSLTMVTPTELINQTTTSLHLSYAPQGGGGSLPSSQNILLMPTIESITEPSMNSTIPPPFLVDNSDIEEPSSMTGTVINQESFENNSNITEDSFHFTDEDDEKQDTPSKEDTNTEEDSNFSFELNDFQNDSKDQINELINDEIIQPPIITVRAPTSADVAFRALIKTRTSGRLSQPIKTVSPLATTNKNNLPTCSSVPIQTSRVLRSSVSRISTTPLSENSTTEEINQSNPETTIESISTEPKTPDDYPNGELIEVVSLPEEDEIEYDPAAGITLNLTASQDRNTLSPNSAEEADRSASSSSSSYISYQQDISTPNNPKLPVLSREYSYNTPTTRSAEHRRSMVTNRRSHNTRLIHSMIPRISEQQTTIIEEEKDLSSENTSLCSYPSSSLKPMLSILSTNQTVISEGPPIILQKSLAGSASPSPMITIRKSERLSSSLINLSPRRSIHPLQSSTPSIRNKSLQIVSIDEQEQISTIVPKQFHLNLSKNDIEMFDKQQQVDIPIEIRSMSHESIQTSPERRPRLIDIGIQTTPIVSYRHFQTIEQQTTPLVKHSSSSSCQTTPVVISIQRSNTQQTSPIIETSTKLIFEEEKQHEATPIHSKAIMHLRRNVRFQFTPSTDARLAAKEKLEEDQERLKQEIPIINHNNNTTKQILSDNEREEDTEDEIKKKRKTKKKTTISKKKKHITLRKNDDSSEETIESPIRNQPEKLIPNDDQQTTTTTTTQSKKKILKRSKRHEKKSSPIREPELIVITSSPVQTKRITRKRSNQKTTTIPTSETTSPTEPVSKRAKTTKTIENKQPARVPSPEPPSTRSRSKTPIISSNNIKSISSSESIERILPIKKTKKNSSEINPIENPPISMNNKRKNSTSTIKKSKRRLHSVEQDEGLNTADEEETIQTISHPIEIIPIDLSQEEREKIEGLTVAELKTRLITHGENIPKGIRKADLVALLIKIETNLLKERKQTETAIPVVVPANSTSRKTRRKK